jgi:hypothetical protein
MGGATNQPASRLVRIRDAALLGVPVFLAFTIPPIGFLTSLLLPLLAARVRSRLWPRTSSITSQLCSALAVIGLWVPAMLFLFSGGRVGFEATVWLIIPLCAPTGSGLLVPALLATTVYLAGLATSTLIRHPGPWVLGAWAAPVAYEAASLWLVDSAVIC